MPITTNKTSGAFPEVAIIRKGAAKERREKNGREYETVGKDLGEHFRVVFHPGAGDLAERFITEYGTLEPTKIRAMLPFSNALQCWEAWNEAYNAGRLIARADGDHYLVRRDPLTGEYLVRDGLPHTPWAIGDEITYERNGKQYSLKFRPYGRLKLFLPYTMKAGSSRFVHFILKTTSYYDCVNIEANLSAIQNIANVLNRGNAAGIPIIVYRKLTDICWNHPDGTASREKKWLVYVEADPEWVAGAIQRLNAMALGGSVDVAALLPSGDHPLSVDSTAPDPVQDDDRDEELDPVEPEAIDAEARDVEPEPVREPSQPPTRPYDGETLRAAMGRMAELKAGGVASEKQRKLVGSLMSLLFAGQADSDKRKHTLQRFLVGVEHLREMNDAQVLALLKWLDPQPDGGAWFVPSAMAEREAQSAYAEALIAEGQLELLF